ncbi:MAG: hypothetical protein KME17_14895 [Cyanosarcina radialis HA8281-LM2]|nr:hypothetical protein [Cyanosarcina radialis HA8281-LM2]
MDYNGLGYIFDGLTPGTRDLWEAKHDYGIVLYQGSDRKILQQKNGAIFKVDSALAIEAEIAARCSYGFTAAFSKKGVADFFRARWAGVVDNVDHPYKFDIKHIPYIKSQP